MKAISTKRITKDLINKFSIFNGSKYFHSGILQNYFVLISVKKCIKYFHDTTQIYSWKSNGMAEENIANINQTAILHQLLLIIMYNQT